MMKSRRGISLIEVMVAMTLLGMMATVHTMVTMRFALRNRIAAAGVNRTAAMSAAVDLYSTMPYTSLATNTGCTTLAVPALYQHQRCITMTSLTTTVVRVRIIILPNNTALRPDTTWVDRSVPPSGSIFQ